MFREFLLLIPIYHFYLPQLALRIISAMTLRLRRIDLSESFNNNRHLSRASIHHHRSFHSIRNPPETEEQSPRFPLTSFYVSGVDLPLVMKFMVILLLNMSKITNFSNFELS